MLAEVFALSSRAFLTEAAKSQPRLAVDLGCGPGYTTHLLGDLLGCRQAIGLDNSEHFIRLAQKTATANVSFQLHDVTRVPFPTGPCDLIYSRFLLTHQGAPEALLAAWASQLSRGGRLLVEEVQVIRTKMPLFLEYLRLVEGILADGGHDLYVGARLDAIPAPPGLVGCSSRLARVPVTNDLAAKMFSMNMHAWTNNPFVRKHHSPVSIRELEKHLTDLARGPTNQTGIEWELRQVVWSREN
ncbi:MAG: class I SAM-dependent methyltransferase [Phycisphaerae bacterium]|nr:class I SAM-dependent methyltransferase [Phycisphaerae bacterium]